MTNVYELKPIFDKRQSFYGKAQVVIDDDFTTLVSYSTNILTIIKDDEKAKEHGKVIECEWLIENKPTQTTTRHIKEFLKQNDLDYDLWKKGCYKAK